METRIIGKPMTVPRKGTIRKKTIQMIISRGRPLTFSALTNCPPKSTSASPRFTRLRPPVFAGREAAPTLCLALQPESCKPFAARRHFRIPEAPPLFAQVMTAPADQPRISRGIIIWWCGQMVSGFW
jgi:hypothetical protein